MRVVNVQVMRKRGAAARERGGLDYVRRMAYEGRGGMIAVETNLLVYAHREDLPWHNPAFQCFQQLSSGHGK